MRNLCKGLLIVYRSAIHLLSEGKKEKQEMTPHFISSACVFVLVQGAIVNISSVAAIFPAATFAPYGVAKAAQDKVTQDLAFEFAPKGVRVNSILPGAKPRMFTAHKLHPVTGSVFDITRDGGNMVV